MHQKINNSVLWSCCLAAVWDRETMDFWRINNESSSYNGSSANSTKTFAWAFTTSSSLSPIRHDNYSNWLSLLSSDTKEFPGHNSYA